MSHVCTLCVAVKTCPRLSSMCEDVVVSQIRMDQNVLFPKRFWNAYGDSPPPEKRTEHLMEVFIAFLFKNVWNFINSKRSVYYLVPV